jgi:hypothetical protein
MPQLENKPDPFRRGQQQLSASALNEIIRAVTRQIRGGGGSGASYFGDRVVLSSDQDLVTLPDVCNYLAQFVVLQEFPDYLLCTPFAQPSYDGPYQVPQIYNPYLGQTNPVQVYVAKPYDLQHTPWIGQYVQTWITEYGVVGVYYNYDSQIPNIRSGLYAPASIGLTCELLAGGAIGANATYYYYVVAIANGNIIAISNQVTVTTNEVDQTVELSWGEYPQATSYVVLRYSSYNPLSGQGGALATLASIVTSYTDTGAATSAYSFSLNSVQNQTHIPYYAGDVILAARQPTGYLAGSPEIPVVWMDVNTAGRNWNGSLFFGSNLQAYVYPTADFFYIPNNTPTNIPWAMDSNGFQITSPSSTSVILPVGGWYYVQMQLLLTGGGDTVTTTFEEIKVTINTGPAVSEVIAESLTDSFTTGVDSPFYFTKSCAGLTFQSAGTAILGSVFQINESDDSISVEGPSTLSIWKVG